MGRAQEFAGRHRHRSCTPTGFQTPNILPSTLLRNQTNLLVVSIAKHELERIDMPLEQPPQWQAADRRHPVGGRNSRPGRAFIHSNNP